MTITLVIAGLILLFLVEPFIRAFGGGINGDPGTVKDEVLGVVNWSLSLAIVVALLSIIITGLQALLTPYSEDGVGTMRKALISVLAGLFLITVRVTLAAAFGEGKPAAEVIDVAFDFVAYILGFMTTIAVAVIVYAGVLLLTSVGKEDAAEKAKGIIFRSLLGLVVIGLSYAIIKLVVDFAGGGN